jgi:lysophospholipase L1-like esterase
VPDQEYAFYVNLKAVIEEIMSDGAKVVLIPERPVVTPHACSSQNDFYERNQRVMAALAEKYKIPFAPFPKEIISPENWTDEIHLNSKGEKEKAEHFLPYIVNTLK